ncbi:hypothetical protein FRC06_005502 [Ceratobasidium sp. 370]|nr:hypothetical protein FRC06_005502 [Ceratobasidium sp. 370]
MPSSQISKPPSSPPPSVSLSTSEINKLSDVQVWDMDPNLVCGAARKSWRSDVYDHFELTMERLLNEYGEKYIRFKFTCKTDRDNHPPQFRNRQDTSSGTHNLQRKADACDRRHRASTALGTTSKSFSPARFRALLSLWCTRNHRPVELVQDELFGMIIDELRPGTSLPDRTTLGRDIRGIYIHNMEYIRQYFESVAHIHLAMDGWTAPTSRSYLGIVIVWQRAGELSRAILEFILTPNENDNGDDTDSEADDTQEALVADNVDADKAQHDDAAVNACVKRAFLEFEEEFGIKIPLSDRQIAGQLIPKVAGLANRAHKSAVVQHTFEEIVSKIPSLSCSKRRTLARRMATRWNTEVECLRSHVHFRPAVKKLTADRNLSLKQYELTDAQWPLAETLISELKAFERLTNVFSETQVPSIHQVVPALLKLQDRLRTSAGNSSLPPLLRVAAQASLAVFDKYMHLFEMSGIYWVALVMCPYYKLQWFKDRGYSNADIAAVKGLVHSMFDWMSGSLATPQDSQDSDALDSGYKPTLIDDWLSDDEMSSDTSQYCGDTIESYLSSTLVSKEALRREGLLEYWKKQQKKTPRVAGFALGILSAPASSVDAERAFSGRRLTINHLQHSMSELTFEAKMAVGSWFQTPLLLSVDTAAAILEDKVRT